MAAAAIRSRYRALIALAALVAVATCNGGGDDDDDDMTRADGGDDASCGEKLPLDCRPSFEPVTFDEIYSRVLRPSCSSGTGTQCHGAQGKQARLDLSERDTAFQSLLDPEDARARVVPGKPECSELIKRLEASDRRVRMPLNADPLDEGQRCAIRLWIAEGAEP